jgi:hypothetical protein
VRQVLLGEGKYVNEREERNDWQPPKEKPFLKVYVNT